MEKSWIVAYTICLNWGVKTKFEVFTNKQQAINYYNRLKINILGKKIYESIEI